MNDSLQKISNSEGFLNFESKNKNQFIPTFTIRDHLGNSRVIFSDKNKSLKVEAILAYYPYGKVINELSFNPNYSKFSYQNKEFLQELGLHDFHARYYDAELGRWHNIDPALQMHSPYLAMGNNPVMMIDPDGEWIIPTLAILALTTSDIGYDIQKYYSPVALKINAGLGNEQKFLGFELSMGVPQIYPSIRIHGGVNYFWSDYDNSYTGWGSTAGFEVGVPYFTYSYTRFMTRHTSQSTGLIKIGNPLVNFKFDNDILGDQGDRYRSAGVQVNIYGFKAGLNLFTGDPGLNKNDRKVDENYYYVEKNGNNPNKYRAGVLYFGFGSIKFGMNNEGIRDTFQNKIVHRHFTNSPYFKYMGNRNTKIYLHLGTTIGGTLW